MDFLLIARILSLYEKGTTKNMQVLKWLCNLNHKADIFVRVLDSYVTLTPQKKSVFWTFGVFFFSWWLCCGRHWQFNIMVWHWVKKKAKWLYIEKERRQWKLWLS